LGPLANPAAPKAAAIGVSNEKMMTVMAKVLLEKGVDGFVFRGDDGIDEITLASTTTISTLSNQNISTGKIDPEDFQIPRSPISDLEGGDSSHNASITMQIFEGKFGPHRDAVLLNAAAAIAAYEGRSDLGLNERIETALLRAAEAVDSGAAKKLVQQWAILSNQLT
jgi:anthranilate phosphoribosyltransferase